MRLIDFYIDIITKLFKKHILIFVSKNLTEKKSHFQYSWAYAKTDSYPKLDGGVMNKVWIWRVKIICDTQKFVKNTVNVTNITNNNHEKHNLFEWDVLLERSFPGSNPDVKGLHGSSFFISETMSSSKNMSLIQNDASTQILRANGDEKRYN